MMTLQAARVIQAEYASKQSCLAQLRRSMGKGKELAGGLGFSYSCLYTLGRGGGGGGGFWVPVQSLTRVGPWSVGGGGGGWRPA